jgi:histidinol dehydrogenase
MLDEAIELSNAYAPEHLILQTRNAEEVSGKSDKCRFCFYWTLHTRKCWRLCKRHQPYLANQWICRAYSGVSVDSFVKKITFQKITKEGLQNLGKTIEVMAENEELNAHKNAVSIRLKN